MWGEDRKLLSFKDLQLLLQKAGERAAYEGNVKQHSQSFRATLGSLRPEALTMLRWKLNIVCNSYFGSSIQPGQTLDLTGSFSPLLLFSFQCLYASVFLVKYNNLSNLRALQSWYDSFCSCMVWYVLYDFTQLK